MLYLPDTMANWPWPRAINPHFEDVKAEVDASFRDFKALSPESQEAFDKCDFARLSALTYPNVSRELLRIGCVLNNVYFIVDEYTDAENAAVTQEMLDIVLDALHDPHKPRPEGECILGEIVRQFWARAIQTASLSSQRHLVETFTAYLRATAVEAIDREKGHCRSINDYLKLRRDTCAVKYSVPVCEMGMELPDEVFYHPVIVDLVDCITELCLIDNDMISYNREQATGMENYNLITAIMLELSLDISGAMAWAARYHAEVQKRFMDGLAKVPSWGPSSRPLWARGHHCWKIQQSRLVPLLPKVNCKDASAVVRIMHREQPSGMLGLNWPVFASQMISVT
ncbi:isoprenoid synthase domain-containing protein [Suillus lakei]|nr:isoprenoid synthase domain-containing protein [Suillus lakei]